MKVSFVAAIVARILCGAASQDHDVVWECLRHPDAPQCAQMFQWKQSDFARTPQGFARHQQSPLGVGEGRQVDIASMVKEAAREAAREAAKETAQRFAEAAQQNAELKTGSAVTNTSPSPQLTEKHSSEPARADGHKAAESPPSEQSRKQVIEAFYTSAQKKSGDTADDDTIWNSALSSFKCEFEKHQKMQHISSLRSQAAEDAKAVIERKEVVDRAKESVKRLDDEKTAAAWAKKKAEAELTVNTDLLSGGNLNEHQTKDLEKEKKTLERAVHVATDNEAAAVAALTKATTMLDAADPTPKLEDLRQISDGRASELRIAESELKVMEEEPTCP